MKIELNNGLKVDVNDNQIENAILEILILGTKKNIQKIEKEISKEVKEAIVGKPIVKKTFKKRTSNMLTKEETLTIVQMKSQGMSVKQIARKLGITKGRVMNTLWRFKQKLLAWQQHE